jgi:coenzyme Q-binding protein COQ10
VASVKEECELPFTAEQMFHLVADVESYPLFVPGWHSAKILSRDGNKWQVEQVLDLGLFKNRYISTAVLSYPKRISICSKDSAINSLTIDWCFEARGNPSCKVTLAMAFTSLSMVVRTMASRRLRKIARQTLGAFERRAYELYDAETVAPGSKLSARDN